MFLIASFEQSTAAAITSTLLALLQQLLQQLQQQQPQQQHPVSQNESKKTTGARHDHRGSTDNLPRTVEL